MYPSSVALDKALAQIQKISPIRNLTRAEMFCALADSNGNVSEALGRVSDSEFVAEARMICSVIPVEQMIISSPLKSLHREISSSEAKRNVSSLRVDASAYPSDHEREYLSSMPGSPSLRPLSRSRDLNDRESDEVERNRSESAVMSALLFKAEQDLATFDKTRGPSPHMSLPHMGLTESTPSVKLRGSFIEYPAPSASPLGTKTGSFVGNSLSSNIEAAIRNIEPHSLRESSSSSFPQNVDLKFAEHSVTRGSKSNPGLKVAKKTKSTRLAQTIEEHLAEQIEREGGMVVMSRRDAYRALEDTILAKSDDFDRLKRGKRFTNPFKLAPAELSEYRKFER